MRGSDHGRADHLRSNVRRSKSSRGRSLWARARIRGAGASAAGHRDWVLSTVESSRGRGMNRSRTKEIARAKRWCHCAVAGSPRCSLVKGPRSFLPTASTFATQPVLQGYYSLVCVKEKLQRRGDKSCCTSKLGRANATPPSTARSASSLAAHPPVRRACSPKKVCVSDPQFWWRI